MRFTLVTDGPSDKVLLPILSWLLGQRTDTSFQPQWADLRGLRNPPKTLGERIVAALDLFPCELLFVHRDAERMERAQRVEEIHAAVAAVQGTPPVVCVVPVRMQEAWLLFDEAALRRAAGRPSGKMPLAMPSLKRVEQEPNPKAILHELLRQASGRQGRQAKQMRPRVQVHRLAELMDDFSPLRALPAFRALEEDLAGALERLGCPV